MENCSSTKCTIGITVSKIYKNRLYGFFNYVHCLSSTVDFPLIDQAYGQNSTKNKISEFYFELFSMNAIIFFSLSNVSQKSPIHEKSSFSLTLCMTIHSFDMVWFHFEVK